MCKTCDQVDAIFEEMNKDPYKFILEGGYKGQKHHPMQCPVGQALSDKLGQKVGVDPYTLIVYFKKRNPQICKKYDYINYQIPDNITDFIQQFDNGDYPELELDYYSEPENV